MLYLWLKVLHIVSLISWFTGIFYIWRLFVYHSMTESEETRSTLATMQEKLIRIIMTPAAISTIFFGTWMFILQWDVFSTMWWIWIKVFLVSILVFQHGLAIYFRKRLLSGVIYPHKMFRMLNELPTLLMIGIVIMVVVKPF